MPRKYRKKTQRIRKTPEEINFAVNKVIKDGLKIRRVADDLGFSFSSLQRHVQKASELPVSEVSSYSFKANPSTGKVFTEEHEVMLSEYLQTCSRMHYGLDTKQTKKLAHEYAQKLNISYPTEWDKNKSVGRDWLLGFMDRNKDISLRRPESTSLGRSTSFNKHNVSKFFETLTKLLDTYHFPPEMIYNCDETGCTTVHKPPKVLATKGQKQVGQVTSTERGKLLTVCCFINALGNTQPPAIIFPLKKVQSHNMLINTPENTLGLAHSSGWMTRENFLLTLKHFIKYSGVSKENPYLLLLDNHESHVNIDVVSLAKENGIHLLTFPPHCSHRLQPFDVAVYGPFKAYYNGAAYDWMTSNAGKTLTIYHIPALVKTAFNKAFSRENILASFEKTGIHPLNSNIFSEYDFLMSSVTDRPNPCAGTSDCQDNIKENIAEENNDTLERKTTLAVTPKLNKINIISNIKITPEFVRPLPKAEPRKESGKGRKKGKTRILTDTPEKEELERIETEKQNKDKNKIKRKIQTPEITSDKKEIVGKKPTKKPKLELSDSESEQECPSSGESDYFPEEPEKDFVFSAASLTRGDYVVVKFIPDSNKKYSEVHYVGLVEDRVESNNKELQFEVNFMKKRTDSNTFYFPDTEDKLFIAAKNITLRLPPPILVGGTSRAVSNMAFEIDLGSIKNLR